MAARLTEKNAQVGSSDIASSDKDGFQSQGLMLDHGIVTDISSKKLRRKIDRHVVPIMFACYLLQFLDKVMINVSGKIRPLGPSEQSSHLEFCLVCRHHGPPDRPEDVRGTILLDSDCLLHRILRC